MANSTGRIEPGPGQESVWDYPRPPRFEETSRHIQIVLDGVIMADTRRSKRVLETSHPPVYYIPRDYIRMDLLRPASGRSWCEWKGEASYYDAVIEDRIFSKVAWAYPEPTAAFEAIAGHLAFYPSKMDRCSVDGETVLPQQGDFYGGWITSDIIGPFKGAPGTMGW